MGEDKEASRLRLLEIHAEGEELRATFMGQTKFFRENSSGYQRFVALKKWVGHQLENFVWGFGLRPGILLRTGMLIILAFGFLINWSDATFLSPSGSDEPSDLSAFDSLYVSTVNFSTLGLGDFSPVDNVAKTLCMTEGLLGAVFLGLIAAAAYRKIVRQ